MTYYIVRNIQTGTEDLVEADTKTSAFRLIGEEILVVKVATPAELVKMLEGGINIRRKLDRQMELPIES